MKLGIVLTVFVLLFGACSTQGQQIDSIEGKRRDAAVPPPPPADGPPSGAAGYVSCIGSGPAAACNLASTYCCFNRSAPPTNGECLLNGAACAFGGELHCDSDADCAPGTKCWSYQANDPDIDDAGSAGNLRLTAACFASAPTSEPRQVAGPWHLCYPGDGTCNAGQSCLAMDPTGGIYEFSTAIYGCQPF